MKKLPVILFLIIVCFTSFAQELTKEEKRQAKKEHRAQMAAKRAEELRIIDSMETVRREMAQQRKAEIEQRAEQKRAETERKKGAVSLIVKTTFDDCRMMMDYLIDKMLKNGLVPALIDKDYYIIKTEPKQVFNATYITNYTIYLEQGKVCVRAASTGYGSISVGSGIIRSHTDMVIPVEYGGVEGSLLYEAWKEMEFYLLNIPNVTETIYVKQ